MNRNSTAMLYVPSSNSVIKYWAGDGTNTPNDGVNIDYIYYDIFDCAKNFENTTGGQIDVPFDVEEKFNTIEEATDMVMEFIFGNGYPNYVRMTQETEE